MLTQVWLAGFDWGSLPKDATIVDVGGGVGAVSLALARAFPDLRLVVQDRAKTIEQARSVSTIFSATHSCILSKFISTGRNTCPRELLPSV